MQSICVRDPTKTQTSYCGRTLTLTEPYYWYSFTRELKVERFEKLDDYREDRELHLRGRQKRPTRDDPPFCEDCWHAICMRALGKKREERKIKAFQRFFSMGWKF